MTDRRVIENMSRAIVMALVSNTEITQRLIAGKPNTRERESQREERAYRREEREGRSSKNRCYKCGDQGHKSDECPNPGKVKCYACTNFVRDLEEHKKLCLKRLLYTKAIHKIKEKRAESRNPMAPYQKYNPGYRKQERIREVQREESRYESLPPLSPPKKTCPSALIDVDNQQSSTSKTSSFHTFSTPPWQKKQCDETQQKLKDQESKGLGVSSLKQLEESKEHDWLQAAPWNVNTISQPGFTKTIVNNSSPKKTEELLEEKSKMFKAFVKENETRLKRFGMLKKYDDSKRFLLENLDLACENSAKYLVIWCINLEMKEKHSLMEFAAHQCICIQYILEVSKHLKMDPKECIGAFFTGIQVADEQYKKKFEQELTSLKKRIVHRAQEKLDVAVKKL